MVHLIIIHLFDWSGVWIWERFRVRVVWKILRVNLNITIINGVMINYPHDIQNHRTGVGRRCPGFEVIICRFSVPLSWCISWLVTMKLIELFNLYYNTWWYSVSSTDYSGIVPMSNSYTVFSNNIPCNAEIFNNWMESYCINVCGILRTKMMIVLTWNCQGSWGSNN